MSKKIEWKKRAVLPAQTDYAGLLKKQGLKVLMFGGMCPVQVHAILPDGNHLYFRARGNSWTIAIAPTENEAVDGDGERVLHYRESLYGSQPFEAGYMPQSEVYEEVIKSLRIYKRSRWADRLKQAWLRIFLGSDRSCG